MATHTLRIDFDDATGKLAVVLTSAESVAGGPLARVSIPLSFDAAKEAPPLKRREGESDEAYIKRFAKTIPTQLDLPPELLDGLQAKCKEIVDAIREVAEHYALQAAATHALLAEGKVPEGITKHIRLGSKAKPITGETTTKKE